jgi:hypothetical protein
MDTGSNTLRFDLQRAGVDESAHNIIPLPRRRRPLSSWLGRLRTLVGQGGDTAGQAAVDHEPGRLPVNHTPKCGGPAPVAKKTVDEVCRESRHPERWWWRPPTLHGEMMLKDFLSRAGVAVDALRIGCTSTRRSRRSTRLPLPSPDVDAAYHSD